MSAAAAPRTARFYTAARRHPWVLGKLADWRLPLGPYNAAQIALAVVGGFVLAKTISVWNVLGPLPIAVWLVGIWLLRRPTIGGRHPISAAVGMVALLVQPGGGRIGQRAARDARAGRLGGGFTLEDLIGCAPARRPAAPTLLGPSRVRRARRPQARSLAAHGLRGRRAPRVRAPAAAPPCAVTLLAQARLCARNQTRGT
ncbi:hypothetical protein [Streptomyces sp. NPDC055099]